MTAEALLAPAVVSRGDAHAARLAALFDAHHQRLYRLAVRMTADRDEAKDLVQETFLRVAGRPGLVPDNLVSEEAWLVRMLVNLARDDWRKRAGRLRLEHRHLRETRITGPSLPDAAVIAHRTIWQAMQQLAPRRRAAVILYELEGARVADIARALGIAAVTVRWHLSQGRRELARIIGEGRS